MQVFWGVPEHLNVILRLCILYIAQLNKTQLTLSRTSFTSTYLVHKVDINARLVCCQELQCHRLICPGLLVQWNSHARACSKCWWHCSCQKQETVRCVTSVLNFTAAHICLIALEDFALVFSFFHMWVSSTKMMVSEWPQSDGYVDGAEQAQWCSSTVYLICCAGAWAMCLGCIFLNIFFSFVKLYT